MLPPTQAYIYNGRLYDLKLRSLRARSNFSTNGRQYGPALDGDFIVMNRAMRETTKFSIDTVAVASWPASRSRSSSVRNGGLRLSLCWLSELASGCIDRVDPLSAIFPGQGVSVVSHVLERAPIDSP